MFVMVVMVMNWNWNMYFLYNWYVDLFVNGNMLDNWHFLVDWHLFNVVMMDSMHLVGDVDDEVLTVNERLERYA